VLALVVALYVVATAAGAGQPSGEGGSGPSGSGLTRSLGGVLVLPAASGDVEGALPGCRQGATLTVASGQVCRYRLRTGFLAKRLRLRLTAGSPLVAVQEGMIDPRVAYDRATRKEAIEPFLQAEEGAAAS